MCIWPLPSIRREGVDARERAVGGLVTVATVVCEACGDGCDG